MGQTITATHDVHYYECHVTVDPVFGEDLERFKRVCAAPNIGFKVAKLLMEKGPSTKDSFCTGHSHTYEDMRRRMETCVDSLRTHGFNVRRYKIEAVVFDTRIHGEAA